MKGQKNMNRFIYGLLFSMALSAGAADAKWYFDVSEAQAIAKRDKKLMVLDFTGSDWCGWCMKLKQEVFATPEFNTYARANLVLVEIDLPRNKPLSIEQLMTNQQLQEKFRAEGFPTIIVLNGDGQEVWRLGGYAAGTPADWIRTMDTLKGRSAPIPGLLTPFVQPPAPTSASAEPNKL